MMQFSWFWVVLFLLGALWYIGEPIFLLYQLLREERETDPLLPLVEKPQPEDSTRC